MIVAECTFEVRVAVEVGVPITVGWLAVAALAFAIIVVVLLRRAKVVAESSLEVRVAMKLVVELFVGTKCESEIE